MALISDALSQGAIGPYQLGHFEAAIESYRRAAQGTSSQPERDYLLLQAARLSAR